MPPKKQESTDLVPVSDYRIIKMNPEELRELIEDNLGGIGEGGFSVRDLPMVTVPSGGATWWTVEGMDKPQDYITGVIISQVEVRRYYAKGLDEGGEKGPPDCASEDMITGHGTPGGECKLCPFAEWGSASSEGKERKGQKCGTYRMLVMQLPDSILQTVVQVPPTSSSSIKQYLRSLTTKGLHYSKAITSLSLKAEERGGFKVAIVTPTFVGKVDDAIHAEHIKPLAAKYKAMLAG